MRLSAHRHREIEQHLSTSLSYPSNPSPLSRPRTHHTPPAPHGTVNLAPLPVSLHKHHHHRRFLDILLVSLPLSLATPPPHLSKPTSVLVAKSTTTTTTTANTRIIPTTTATNPTTPTTNTPATPKPLHRSTRSSRRQKRGTPSHRIFLSRC